VTIIITGLFYALFHQTLLSVNKYFSFLFFISFYIVLYRFILKSHPLLTFKLPALPQHPALASLLLALGLSPFTSALAGRVIETQLLPIVSDAPLIDFQQPAKNLQDLPEFQSFQVIPVFQIAQTLQPLPEFAPTPAALAVAQATIAEADTLTGTPHDTLRLRGSVHLERDTVNLRAQEVDYCPEKNDVAARGKVVLTQGDDVFKAQQLTLNLLTETGSAESPEYFFGKIKVRGNADRLTLAPNRQRILDNATYTSCKPGQNDWLLKAHQLILDEGTQTGTAQGMSLRFMGVPIFGAPYFEFPLGKERRSGVLPPTTGYNSVSGIELSVPYYFNLAHNYDATLTTRYMTRRGLQLTADTRYLTEHMQGDTRFEYVPNDKLQDTQKKRWGIFSHHTYQLKPSNDPQGSWSFGANIERVSDDTFLADLSHNTLLATQTSLPTEVWATYQTQWGELNARASRYQTLQDASQSIVPAYSRVPSVDLQLTPISLPQLGGMVFNLEAQVAQFTHATATQGIRAYAVPQLSRDWLADWGFIKAKAKLNMAHYAKLRGEYYDYYEGTGHFSRAIPIASLDMGLTFERIAPWLGSTQGVREQVTHTVEPRLYFVYAPFKDQAAAPSFDSSLSSFNFDQIFSDNIFTGQDRIANAAHITPALTTQWLNPNTGTVLLKGTVGKRFYFDQQRVTLDGASLPNESSGGVDSSDWLLTATGQPITSLYFDTALQYDQHARTVINSNYTVRYSPESRRTISLSKRFTKDSQHALDVSWQWQVGTNHALLGKVAYSLGVPSIALNAGLTETLLGYEYDAGCWVFRIAANRYINTANVKATSFAIQLDLSGLTQSGTASSTGSLNMLSTNIPSYRPF
jgi:LPS-assembly protein